MIVFRTLGLNNKLLIKWYFLLVQILDNQVFAIRAILIFDALYFFIVAALSKGILVMLLDCYWDIWLRIYEVLAMIIISYTDSTRDSL